MKPELLNSRTPRQSRSILAMLGCMALQVWLGLMPQVALAQTSSASEVLARNRYRSGEDTLRAFKPVSAATRDSIVKLNVDGATVALAVIVDTNGMALTKASELKKGALTGWLASEKEVPVEKIAVDDEEDVALIHVHADGLKPIQWADEEVVVGEWAITPGVAETPHAVGIISTRPRRIRPPRAYIGIQFDSGSTAAKIGEVTSGLSAEKAGLKPGDTIVAVNDSAVTNREQVVEALREFREGQTVKLSVQRGDEPVEAEVQMMAPTADLIAKGFYPEQRASRVSGDVSQRAGGFEQAIEHDTVLEPWLCGGPLVNLDGKAIGLNIARAGRVTSYALPTKLVKQILEKLQMRAKAKSIS